MKRKISACLIILLLPYCGMSQSLNPNRQDGVLLFKFDGNTKAKNHKFNGHSFSFVKGIDGQAISIQDNDDFNYLELEDLSLDGKSSFTVQFWIKTASNEPTVILSQKDFLGKGILSQKNAGWAFYSSGGTFAWTIGSGDRRLNYERDNGHIMPINDGLWHQLTMSYNKDLSEIRLFYDGLNKVVYKVGFEFNNDNHLIIGSKKGDFNYDDSVLPIIKEGALQLQTLVDSFNSLAVEDLSENEFISLIVDPVELLSKRSGSDKANSTSVNLSEVNNIRKSLGSNPYTTFQNKNLTTIKPISKLYSVKNGIVMTNNYYAKKFTDQERLYSSDFSMDNLFIWQKAITDEEVLNSYRKYRKAEPLVLDDKLDTLIVASWNIWHGGKHYTDIDNDWDSRLRIVEIIKKNEVDIILMQETYSSGDFIAAELGYYFATTSDWDYKDQGSNISVLSRYPIKELEVPLKAEFMNVAARLTLSTTQEIYAISNWYGMGSFPLVYEFHKSKFEQADEVPILFGGDFNAVPHTDGGDSPASIKMAGNGLIDAFRNLHSNIETFPGYTHQWGERIDQLYYKGKGLNNTSTKVIYAWPGGFPSDHFMILSKFRLKN